MMQFVSQIMQKGMKSGYELGKGGYEVRKILRGGTHPCCRLRLRDAGPLGGDEGGRQPGGQQDDVACEDYA